MEDRYRHNPDGSITLLTPNGGEHTYDPRDLGAHEPWDTRTERVENEIADEGPTPAHFYVQIELGGCTMTPADWASALGDIRQALYRDGREGASYPISDRCGNVVGQYGVRR